MNRKFYFILLCVFLLGSCKNSIDNVSPTQTDLTTDEAQKWFTNYQRNKTNTARQSDQQTRKSLENDVDWSDALPFNTSFGNGVIVSLIYEDAIIPKRRTSEAPAPSTLTNKEDKTDLTWLAYLYIYKDKAGNNHAETVTAIPNADWDAGDFKSFSGIMFIDEWNGNYSYGYYFENGIVKSKLKGEGEQPNQKGAKMVPLITDYWQYAYCPSCPAGGGGGQYQIQFLRSETTYVDDGTGPGTDDSGTQYQSIIDYGSASGGSGSPGGNSDSYSYNIKIKNPCLKENVMNTLHTDCVRISTVINDIFGNDDFYHLRITDGIALPDTVYARTIPGRDNVDRNGKRHFWVTIALNINTVGKASKEFVTAVVLHEALHAYLDASPDAAQRINQHENIAENFVDWMVQGLQTIYTNMPNIDAKGISLFGLGMVDNYDLIIRNYGFLDVDTVEYYEIKYNGTKPRDQSRGTYCQN